MTARYISAYLKPSVGQVYEVCVSGLTTAGIFVRIEDLGAEGLIPMNSLPNDKYTLSENRCLLSASKPRAGVFFWRKNPSDADRGNASQRRADF